MTDDVDEGDAAAEGWGDPFAGATDTRVQILGAAFHALCEHGYANLTIQKIGAEFEKSPSLVYHHYDGKDDLLLDLLEYLLDHFEEQVPGEGFPEDPRERIEETLAVSFDPGPVETEYGQFMVAMMELRAQAIHDDRFKRHFERSDAVLHGFVADVIRGGIERGTFAADADPDAIAQTIRTASLGATFRWATTTDRSWTGTVEEGVRRYVEDELYEDGAEN